MTEIELSRSKCYDCKSVNDDKTLQRRGRLASLRCARQMVNYSNAPRSDGIFSVAFHSLKTIQPPRSASPSSRGDGLSSAGCRLGLSLKVGDLLLKSYIRMPYKVRSSPKMTSVTTKKLKTHITLCLFINSKLLTVKNTIII